MDTLGNYVLLEEFSSTSLGKIFKSLPIKGEPSLRFFHLLNDEVTKDAQSLTILKTYISKWKNIKDINILNLTDSVEKDGKLGYIFEYERGRLLSDLLQECQKEGMPIAYDQAVYLISRIIDAVVSVTSEDFFYGNINSEMVFITFEGEVKLLPGVLRDLQTTPLRHSSILEKYLMSYGDDLKSGRPIKQKDQIYFLGLILFEFLTRETFEIPKVGFQPEERLKDAKAGLGLSDGLPDNLYKILEKSLLKKENSYKSLDEMKAEIDDLISSGEYSPSTFNTAFLMHTLYRNQDEIESKKDEEYIKLDRKQFEPKKKVVIPQPKVPTEEKPLPTFGIEEETKPSKKRMLIGIGSVALVVIIVLGFILTSQSSKKNDEKVKSKDANELRIKELEEKVHQYEEEVKKLQLEAKAREEELAKAKTPEEKLKAQKALEETQKKLFETQKLNPQATVSETPKMEEKTDTPTKEETHPSDQSKSQPPIETPPQSKNETTPPSKNEPMAEISNSSQQVAPPPPTEIKTEAKENKVKEGDFIDFVNVDVKPNKLNEVKPDFPPLARQNNFEGRVYIKVTIDENGKVINAEIVKCPEPDYGVKESCINAAKKLKFSPAIKNGVKVKTSMVLNFYFKMSK